MILFRAILFFFIFITPLKSDTIYNLIKIPNLEIYNINTKNGLRYLYATKPFRLGLNIKKNITLKVTNAAVRSVDSKGGLDQYLKSVKKQKLSRKAQKLKISINTLV